MKRIIGSIVFALLISFYLTITCMASSTQNSNTYLIGDGVTFKLSDQWVEIEADIIDEYNALLLESQPDMGIEYSKGFQYADA